MEMQLRLVHGAFLVQVLVEKLINVLCVMLIAHVPVTFVHLGFWWHIGQLVVLSFLFPFPFPFYVSRITEA